MAGEELGLVSYDPETKLATAIQIPQDLVINTAYGYGNYLAKSLVGLDDQEGFGGELVTDSLAKTLGVVIDGRLVLPAKQLTTSKVNVLRLLSWGLWKKLTFQGVTDLSWWDLVRIWKVVLKLRDNKWDQVDLVDAQVVRSLTLPDGSLVYQPDSDAIFKLTANVFTSEALAGEGIKVLVLNTTDVNGAGSTLAQMVRSLGVYVVGVEGGNEAIAETSQIRVSDKQVLKTRTVKMLKRLLRVDTSLVADNYDDRADVVVVLGRDISGRYR